MSGESWAALHQQLQDLRDTLNERYATQVTVVDQALLTETTAIATAFAAADEAVQEAFGNYDVQNKKETLTV